MNGGMVRFWRQTRVTWSVIGWLQAPLNSVHQEPLPALQCTLGLVFGVVGIPIRVEVKEESWQCLLHVHVKRGLALAQALMF